MRDCTYVLRPPLFAAFILGLSAPTAAAQPAPRPNILFVFTDDHASHAIGAYGSRINKTPHIDRLAAEGMLFRNCFCTNSICAPSRAAILTGKHSHLNGVMTNRERFDGSQQTFPKLLQQAGYQTAMIGKWHLKTAPTGFDYWRVLIGQGPYYNPPLRTPEGTEKHTGYTTDILTDLTLDWLRAKRDPAKPFLLMYQHKAPHREWAPGPRHLRTYDDVTIPEPPTLFDDWSNRTSAAKTQTMTVADHLTPRDLKLVPPGNLTAEQLEAWNAAYGPKNAAFEKAGLKGADLVRWKYQRYIKDYLRTIASVDDNLGRVLAYLDESGLAKNTVVIYSSDQGFYLGDHGWYDKRWMYEESLRMPLIVRWPGVTKPGSENRRLVQNIDFGPTFLAMAGVEVPRDMQGRSLVPLLRGGAPEDWRRSIYYHYWEFPGPHSVQRHYGVRTATHKLVRYYAIDEWELFDLREDPDELRSVHADPSYAGVFDELKRELERLQTLYKDTEPHASAAAIDQRQLRRLAAKVELREVLRLAAPDGEPRRDLDPAVKPLTVGAWCTPTSGDGVLVAQGGEALGYTLYLEGGVPHFGIRNQGEFTVVKGSKVALNEPVHLVGVLNRRGKLRLIVNGESSPPRDGFFIASKPADALTIGRDAGSRVGDYKSEMPFQGELKDIRVYWGVLDKPALREWAGR